MRGVFANLFLLCYAPLLGQNDSIPGINDLQELEGAIIEYKIAGADSGCPVKVNSIPVKMLDRSASSSRILAIGGLSGVDLITAGGGTVRPSIRGLSGQRIATLYRGARIESQAWGEDHGIYLPEQGVSRVEVIKGPSAIAYGADCIGGVVNFVQETPLQEIGRKSDFSLRTFSATDGYKASIITRRRSENAHHSFCGGYNSHGDYMTPNQGVAVNSKYDQFFAQGVFGYVKDWGLIDGAYSSAYNISGIISNEGWQQSGDHLITVNSTFLLGLFKVKPTLTYQLNHRKEFHSHEGEDSLELDMSLRTANLEIKGVRSFTTYGTIIIGLQGNVKTNTNGEEIEELYIPNATSSNLGAYSIYAYQINKFSFKGAIRGDYKVVIWDEESRAYPMAAGSLGVNYKLTQNARLNLIGSLSNRAPSIAELTADGVHHGAFRYERGDAYLEAETAKNIEVSLNRVSQNLRLDISLFRNQIDGFIHYKPTDEEIVGYTVYDFTATDALIEGGEFGVAFQEKMLGLTAKANLTYFTGSDLIANESLPFIPPITLGSSLDYERDELGKFSDFYAIASYTKTPGFQVFNLSTGLSLNEMVDLQLSASNLFNEEYVPVMSLLRELNIPQPGRDISVKLSFNF